MKALYKSEDDVIDYTPAGDTVAGEVVIRNGEIGVTTRPILAGVQGALVICGVFEVVKKNEAFTDGQKLYWDPVGDPYTGTAGTGALTASGSGTTFWGFAVGAAGANDVTARALLVPRQAHDLTFAIADPGNAGAIPVLSTGHVAIVTAAAETRTLANPSREGQELLIFMKTDGGDCVITAAAGFDATPHTTITLNDAGDAVRLVAIRNGATLRWILVFNSGATLG